MTSPASCRTRGWSPPQGSVVAEELIESLSVDRGKLPEIIHAYYELTEVFVHVMLDRARHFTSSDRHDEKTLSLGRLAAGLAHELNNPASAVARSAEGLAERLAEMDQTSRALGSTGLSATELDAVDRVRDQCLSAALQVVRTPLEQADREDLIAGWLADSGADVTAAEALAESAVTIERLDQLAEVLQGQTLDATPRSIAAACVTRRLVSEIEAAASCIYRLVAALKGSTYMDQAAAACPVEVGQGLTYIRSPSSSPKRGRGR